jgi:hypothetical protein
MEFLSMTEHDWVIIRTEYPDLIEILEEMLEERAWTEDEPHHA